MAVDTHSNDSEGMGGGRSCFRSVSVPHRHRAAGALPRCWLHALQQPSTATEQSLHLQPGTSGAGGDAALTCTNSTENHCRAATLLLGTMKTGRHYCAASQRGGSAGGPARGGPFRIDSAVASNGIVWREKARRARSLRMSASPTTFSRFMVAVHVHVCCNWSLQAAQNMWIRPASIHTERAEDVFFYYLHRGIEC